MAATTLTNPVFVGHPLAGTSSTGSTWRSSPRLDSSPTQIAWLIQPLTGGDVESVSFYASTVTTAQDIDVQIQTIDTNGDPSGTVITNGGSASSVSPSTGWNTWTFATAPTLSAGLLYAVVMDWNSTAGDVTFLSHNSNTSYTPMLVGGTSSWASLDAAASPLMRLKYDDGTYPFIPSCHPGYQDAVNIGNSQTIKEAGLRFKIPFPARLAGFMGLLDLNNVGAKPTFEFYTDAQAPGAGTELHQVGDQGAGEDDVDQGTAAARHIYVFSNPQTIEKDTWYRFTYHTQDTTLLYRQDGGSDAALGNCGMTDMVYTETTDDTNWSADAGMFLPWALMLDQLDDGVGGGGGGNQGISQGLHSISNQISA